MAEQLQQRDADGVTIDTRQAAVAVAVANTDPENGQLLQPDDAPKSLQIDQYLEKLLSRVRSDSVYELRKLRHQHRPVSDFASKQTLEELLGKRHQIPPAVAAPPFALPPDPTNECLGPDEEQHSEVEKRVKQLSSIAQGNADAASPQEHMPSAIRLEIRGLFERRRVSGFLDSTHAEDIERTLQEGLERRSRRQQGRRARPSPEHPQASGRASLLEQIRGHQMPRSGDSASGTSPPQRHPENGQYQVPRRDQSSIVRQLRESPALNTLQPAERDRVLTEVNYLVQQHLVTSALSGEFRGVLELHIQNRADQMRDGVTGDHSLQRRSNHSASSAARWFDPDEPSSASMSEMRQELREMKSQVLELKQLMRTSFDLQLEIQRAIRQEVAAALASVCSPSTHSGPSVPTVMRPGTRTAQQSSVVANSGNCVICSEASINSVMYRCGHMCVCMQCGLELKAQGLKCPICRAPITDIVRAYSSMQ